MKLVTTFVTLAIAFAATSAAAQGIEPIPGSITYNGQPRTKLTKSPVGSTFSHYFKYRGDGYAETYRIQPDRSLEIIARRRSDLFNFSGRDR